MNKTTDRFTKGLRLLVMAALLVGLVLGVGPHPRLAAAQAPKMYVANTITNTVSQADLDGTGGVSLGNLNGTLYGPRGIALDVAAGKMYVTNAANNTVSQANLDGTGGVSLGNLNSTLSMPVGIALGLAQEPGPPPEPVGGIVVPVDRLGLVAPWLGLAALISLAALTVAVVRRRRGS